MDRGGHSFIWDYVNKKLFSLMHSASCFWNNGHHIRLSTGVLDGKFCLFLSAWS